MGFALRAAPILDDPQLIVRKVMETPWAFYRAAAWPLERGVPQGPEDLPRFPLATLEGRPEALLRSAVPGATPAYAARVRAGVAALTPPACRGAGRRRDTR